MRKHVFITALLAALVLCVSASAWAAQTGGYTIDSMTTAYKTVYSADVHAGYFASIVIRANLKNYESKDNAPNYAVSADTLTWSVTNSDGALLRCKVVSLDKYEEVSTMDISDMGYAESTATPYRVKLVGTIAKAGTVKVKAALSGKSMKANNGTLTSEVEITFTATSRDNGTVIKTNETGDDAPAEDVSASSIAPDSDTHDPRDPASREWNGLFPPFTLNTSGDAASGVKASVSWAKPEDFTAGVSTDTIVATVKGPATGINVYIAAKDTVKLYGIEKTAAVDIPLTSKNISLYNIPFRVTVIDDSKNIATGDKKKDKDVTTTVTVAFNGGNFEYKGFPLTISAWNANNADKPAAKTVKLNITPNDSTPEWGTGRITYAAILVGATATTTTVTGPMTGVYFASNYTEWISSTWRATYNSLPYTSAYYYVGTSDFDYPILKNDSGKPLEVKYYFKNGVRKRYEYNSANITAGIYPLYSTYNNTSFGTDTYGAWAYGTNGGNGYKVEQRGKYWHAKVPTVFYVVATKNETYTQTTYTGGTYKPVKSVDFTSMDLKAKHEIIVGIYPEKEKEEQGGSVTTTTYNVLAPAPYTITAKTPKDEGIRVSITQPKFDYLGEVTTLGAVTIFGTLSNTTKETKNAISLTAQNPSTKKKATLKTTVVSKTPPSFKKLQDFTFDESVLGDTATDEAFVSSYGYSDTRKKLKTKRVIMPKLPKAKLKASTGSKTITYKLGLYDEDGEADWKTAYSYTRSKFTEDAELWDYMYGYVVTHDLASGGGYGEQFNEELEANLLAHGMSFDAKKCAIVLVEKGGKTTPTLNEDGSNFASLDLVITAMNEVGAAQAWADLPITGEKPKVADKSLVLTGSVEKGDVFKFKLLGGKTAAESVTEEGGSINVRSYTAKDADTKVLSDWGLELVNYDTMYILVSDEVSFDAGEEIPAYSTAYTKIVDTGDYDNPGNAVVATTTDGVTTYTAGSSGATLLSGDTWVRSKDISYINYGLVQVIDPDKLAEVVQKAKSADSKGKATKKLEKGSKVNLILDNLGAAAKGKITVCLESDIKSAGDRARYNNTSSNGALPANNSALPAVNTAAPEIARITGTLPDSEADSDSDTEEDVTVTIGAPRTVANLTAGQKAFLTEKGYTVIAVLPEISANADGQQEFDVTLDEDAPEGAKLVYVPFPKNAQPSDDDSIADFYDADGQAIEEVPAEKDITVSPWLREGVIYEPVIAAKSAE